MGFVFHLSSRNWTFRSESSRPNDTAGVVARPPLVCLTSIIAGVGIDALWPAPVFPDAIELPLGAGLVIVSLAVFGLSLRAFLHVATPIPTNRPTIVLV